MAVVEGFIVITTKPPQSTSKKRAAQHEKQAIEFWSDDVGFIISAELVLVLTIGVLGMVVGLNSVASAINQELNDLSGAFGTIDQSYFYSGLKKWWHAGVSGSAYVDRKDFCDCTIMGVSGTIQKHDAVVAPPVYVAPCPGPFPEPATPCNGCDLPDSPLQPVPENPKDLSFQPVPSFEQPSTPSLEQPSK